MASPEFSVVVCAYNEEDYVGPAIRSVLAQTREDFELVVVDDGSTDGTAEAVAAFRGDPRIKLISQDNAGLSAARNTGVAAATAETIAFLDADDLWMPPYLERMSAALADRPDAGFAYTDAWWLDDDSGRFYRASAMSVSDPPADPPTEPAAFLALLMHANFVFVSTMARREALEAAGEFDPALKAIEDYDMWIRVLGCGFAAVRAPGRLAVKRDRGSSMSRDHTNMYVNLREVCRRAAEDYELPEQVRAIARDRVDRLDRDLAALSGEDRARGAWFAARARLGRARKKLLGSRIWHRRTPPEVAAAFPELVR